MELGNEVEDCLVAVLAHAEDGHIGGHHVPLSHHQPLDVGQ